jgi:RsiW-degrading membrane proteinase PrsW (M82 family)
MLAFCNQDTLPPYENKKRYKLYVDECIKDNTFSCEIKSFLHTFTACLLPVLAEVYLFFKRRHNFASKALRNVITYDKVEELRRKVNLLQGTILTFPEGTLENHEKPQASDLAQT